MAKPRIFISSTFYDLRHVREDLERFTKELGYERPVRNEAGSIPYGKQEALESYTYQEVELSDIIVTIIGGRFGTESQQEVGYSITQNELRRALDRNVQVFIFIEQGVLSEFSTYKLNKANKDIKYQFVDDIRIYEFIEKLYQLPRNNPIASFQISKDITEYLRAQWAGLFQRFLREQNRISEIKVLDEVKSVAGTLQQLVEFLTTERKSKDAAIQSILLSNHPAFRRFGNLTNAPYRVFFSNLTELNEWLKARSWEPLGKDAHDADSVLEWAFKEEYIKLTEPIFDDDGKLKIYSEHTWVHKLESPQTGEEEEEGPEIPF